MQHSRGLISSQPGHLEALRVKHRALKELVRQEQKKPAAAEDILKSLKLEKLKVKEEIEEELRKS